jgi:UDP-glucose 4-epimerase
MKMKILVTGGMGVLGSAVCGRIVGEGHRPVVMSRSFDRNLIGSIQEDIDIELGDVLDLPRLLSIIQTYKVTHIIHMAALIGALSAQNPPQSVHVNVVGTLNILEAARLMGVQRVIFTSAKGVYGNIGGEYGHPGYKPLPEGYPKDPYRIYDSEKLMGEHMGQFYRRTYGLEFAAIRFSSTFGPGKTVRHGDKAVLSRLVEGAFAGKPVKIDKGGDQKNDYIYNKDAAQGVFLACITTKLNHTEYNIGSGAAATLKDFADAVRHLVPGAKVEVGPGISGEMPNYSCIYDISRAKEDLGYKPRFNLKAAVEDYLNVLRSIDSRTD